ncbi:DnaD domain protein [Lacticaseibacillus absianus]|uniref:DnaD domain-containing protein n=1 Tax=Lacticaseibacillus absianus TaxID=2729623 RepID=UPI0015C7D454|nr:DnaD domain protein [Lacticaseibacillus absianus]
MADGGWIALQRKIQTSFVWANPYVLKLWLLILFKAGFSENKFLFNGKEVRVDRGQFVTGRVALASEYNQGVTREHMLSPTSINRWLKKFRDLGMVDIQTNARYSVITVINYDLYQPGGQLVDTRRTASGQQVDTIKNSNNSKKESSSSSARSDVLDFWQQNGFGPMAPKVMQDLDFWVKDLQAIGASEASANQLLIKAMSVAIDNGARNYGYVNGVLRNWEGKGFTTPEAVDAFEAERAAQRAAKRPGTGRRPNTRAPIEGHVFTDEDLPF